MLSMTKPRNLAELREVMTRDQHLLTNRMRDAARYIIDHPNDVALNSVASIAQRAGVPPPAFVRLAKALGYEGFSDMQRMFREPLERSERPNLSERIRHFRGEDVLEDPTDIVNMLRTFSKANRISLEHLSEEAAVMPLQEVVDTILAASVVHVIGARRSFPIATYLAYALNRVGRPTVHINGLGGTFHEQAIAVRHGDVLLAISFPPYADETVTVCREVVGRGIPLISITDGIFSPIAKDAKLMIEVNDAELQGFRSLTASMCVAQTIAMGLAFKQRKLRSGDTDEPLADINC
jgi:DNA-binding MurR/RpiR family transcriptional regulator